jgi:hypothetical protein
MIESPFKQVKDFKLSDLNKKLGQLMYIKANDCDFNEGKFTDELWFMDADMNLYLIMEVPQDKDEA